MPFPLDVAVDVAALEAEVPVGPALKTPPLTLVALCEEEWKVDEKLSEEV